MSPQSLNEKLKNNLDPNWICLDVSPGWVRAVEELVDKLKQIQPQFKVIQIKEKLGGLRFYSDVTVGSPGWELICETERRCWHICSDCGLEDQDRVHTGSVDGYKVTACPNCLNQRHKLRLALWSVV